MKKIVNFFKNLLVAISKETAALAWTLGGTGLVLITLSGETQKIAIYITIASGILHFAGVLIPRESRNDEPSGDSDK